MERVRGIEPRYSAWEADVLPLNYTRRTAELTVVGSPRPARDQPPPNGRVAYGWRNARTAASTADEVPVIPPRLRSAAPALVLLCAALSACSADSSGDESQGTTPGTRSTSSTIGDGATTSTFDDTTGVTEEPSAFENWDKPPTTFDPEEAIAAEKPVRGPATTISTGRGAGPSGPSGYTGMLGILRLDQVLFGASAPAPDTAPGTAPLTGLSGSIPNRPAVVVKVDNSPAARPQRGLNLADIVIEEQVEGGVTRFAAVFHSQMSVVGPIRSARTTDISFINALGGPALLYSGANRIIDSIMMRQETIQNYSAARASGYWRDASRRVPHNLFTDTASFIHRGTSPPAQFAYRQSRTGSQITGSQTTEAPTSSTSETTLGTSTSDSHTTTSQTQTSQTQTSQTQTTEAQTSQTTSATTTTARRPAVGVAVSMLNATLGQTRVRWDWNGASWLRTQNGTAHKTDNTQVSAANVVVAVVPEGPTGLFDSVRTPVPEYIFAGSGRVSVFTDGRRIDGTWTRPTLRSPAVLTDANGVVIELTPGRTWVELVLAGTYQSS